ncbi:hypothetical protein BKA69DRAFT_1171173 [Paraphysoderma sedebokerense]|nr:hypothetical protein BKA69DRAFT_1171173 [Paraphysoderma sedebokerense]
MFQRPYQWGPEHVAKLVQDVDSARRSGEFSYFAGNIVLVESGTPGDYFIIDGQQRITTIVMIVSVCRHHDPQNENIYTNWLARPQLQGITKPYRLWPDNADNQTANARLFEDNILTLGGIERLLERDEIVGGSRYVARLRQNAMRILELLQEIGQENTLEFTRYVVNQCKFFNVISKDLEVAYKVFCSINLPSGLPLARMDFYRAKLYGTLRARVGDRTAQRCLREWNDTERNVGDAEQMPRFLIHFCCVQMHSDTTRDAAWRIGAIRNAFDRKESISEPMIQVLFQEFFNRLQDDRITRELRRFSHLYRKIVKTEQYLQIARQRNYPLRLLRYMSTQTQRWDLWITLSLKAAAIAAPAVENSTIFWKKLEMRFAYWVITQTKAETVVDACNAINEKFHHLRPNQVQNNYQWNELNLNEREVSRFQRTIQGNIYSKSKSAFPARYLMLNLEQRRSQLELLNTLATGQFGATVEHICPQTPRPGSNWLQEPWSEELRRKWLHKIGNIAILERTHNTEVSNFSWDVKSDVYRNNRSGETTPFYYTRELCDNSDWTPDLCATRQKQLEKELFDIYDLFDGGGNADADGGAEDDESVGDEDGNHDEDEPNLDNEVMDDPTENVTEEAGTELCEKTVKGVSDAYKDLKCDGQRGLLERYCRKCHSWDSENGQQCKRDRKSNSPFCENHIGKRVKRNTGNPTTTLVGSSPAPKKMKTWTKLSFSASTSNASATKRMKTKTTQDVEPAAAKEKKGKGKATEKLEGNQSKSKTEKTSVKRSSSASTSNASATKKMKTKTTQDVEPAAAKEKKGKGKATEKLEENQSKSKTEKTSVKRSSSASTSNVTATEKTKIETTQEVTANSLKDDSFVRDYTTRMSIPKNLLLAKLISGHSEIFSIKTEML